MQFLITTSYLLAGELTALAHLGLFARPTKTAMLRRLQVHLHRLSQLAALVETGMEVSGTG